MKEDKSIEEMTVAELKSQADDLGIVYDKKSTKAELISAIDTLINGAEADAAADAEIEQLGVLAENETRIAIVIAESEKDKQPVAIGVNGRTYLIKRGKRVEVPESVVEVLNNAKRKVFDSNMEYHEVPRYPFQAVI